MEQADWYGLLMMQGYAFVPTSDISRGAGRCCVNPPFMKRRKQCLIQPSMTLCLQASNGWTDVHQAAIDRNRSVMYAHARSGNLSLHIQTTTASLDVMMGEGRLGKHQKDGPKGEQAEATRQKQVSRRKSCGH